MAALGRLSRQWIHRQTEREVNAARGHGSAAEQAGMRPRRPVQPRSASGQTVTLSPRIACVALQSLMKALEIRERLLGLESALACYTRDVLANHYFNQGRSSKIKVGGCHGVYSCMHIHVLIWSPVLSEWGYDPGATVERERERERTLAPPTHPCLSPAVAVQGDPKGPQDRRVAARARAQGNASHHPGRPWRAQGAGSRPCEQG